MPARDLALRLWVKKMSSGVRDAVFLQILGQLARDTAGAVVGKQPEPMSDHKLIQTGKAQRIIQRIRLFL